MEPVKPVNAEIAEMTDGVVASSKRKDELEAAFVARKAEIEAIDEEDGRANGIDLVQAAATIHGALARVLPFRDAAVKLDASHAEDFDLMEEAVVAAEFTHIEVLTLSQPTEPIAELLERGRDRLDRLLAAAVGLAHAGLLPADYLSEMKGGRAYQDLALDLMYIARLFAQRWATLGSKTHIVEADWNEAREVGHALFKALQRRDQQSSARDAMVALKNKARVVMATRWDRCRRALTYLRWDEGDANELAPSLFAARMKRKPAPAGDTTPPPVPPVVTPIVGPAPVPVASDPYMDEPFTT